MPVILHTADPNPVNNSSRDDFDYFTGEETESERLSYSLKVTQRVSGGGALAFEPGFDSQEQPPSIMPCSLLLGPQDGT